MDEMVGLNDLSEFNGMIEIIQDIEMSGMNEMNETIVMKVLSGMNENIHMNGTIETNEAFGHHFGRKAISLMFIINKPLGSHAGIILMCFIFLDGLGYF